MPGTEFMDMPRMDQVGPDPNMPNTEHIQCMSNTDQIENWNRIMTLSRTDKHCQRQIQNKL